MYVWSKKAPISPALYQLFATPENIQPQIKISAAQDILSVVAGDTTERAELSFGSCVKPKI